MTRARIKTLASHRTLFTEGYNSDLESLLVATFQKLQAPRDRIVSIDLVSSMAFASAVPLDDGGLFVRVLEFEAGATGVINFDTDDVDSIVEAFDHPEKKDFLKEEIFLLVDGDSVLSCGMGNKAGTFSRCMLDLCRRAETLASGIDARLADMPDRTTVSMLKKVGVKKLELSLVGLMGELNLDLRDKAGARALQMIFGLPAVNRMEAQRRANAAGKIVLTRGRFEKEELEVDQWLSEIGAEVVDAGSAEQYRIELEDGRILSNASLKQTRKVKLNRHANSVDHLAALAALKQFRRDLIAQGDYDDR